MKTFSVLAVFGMTVTPLAKPTATPMAGSAFALAKPAVGYNHATTNRTTHDWLA